MATYLKGVTDYIPALEPFKPDYKFLSDVLSVRQDRYDSNYKELNDLYSKVVYAPLTRADNQEQREQYANRLSNGLKQVSGLDLSLQGNVDVAKGLFKPFFEDKSLLKDMAATKLYSKENQRANSYLNSPDDKVSKQYWDTGVQGLNMWMDKFKNASAEKALSMGMPQYVPNPDLYNTAFNSLKDSGLSIKQTTLDGDWIVTTENGTALTRQVTGYKRNPETKELIIDPKTEKPIPIYSNPAAQHLMNTVMQDPQIKRAYLLEAQVEEWKWMKDNKDQYSGVDDAKKAWSMEIIEKYANEETKKLVDNEAEYKQQSITTRNWEQWKKHNKVVPGSSEEEIMALVAYNTYIAKSNKNATESRLMDLKGPKSDTNSLLSTAYSAYMGFHMSPKMNAAAVAYSQVDASQTFKANPFKKIERQHHFNLNKIALQHEFDMKKMYAKAEVDYLQKQLELGDGSRNQGGMVPISGNANISGSLTGFDKNNDGKISESERSFVDGQATNIEDWQLYTNKLRDTEMKFIEGIIKLFPNDVESIRGYQGAGNFEYTFYDDALAGNSSKKIGTINELVKDLSNPNNKYAALNNTELDALIKNFEEVYLKKAETKDGAILSYILPSENSIEGSSLVIGSLYESIQDFRTAFSAARDTEQKVLKNVFRRVVAEDSATANSSTYKNQEHSVPPIYLTQGEIDMLNQGIPWYKVHYASKSGNLVEPIKGGDDQPIRRMVSNNEYAEIYANMNSLQKDQKQLLSQAKIGSFGLGNTSVSSDDYNFFLKESGNIYDDEYLAEQFWSWNPDQVANTYEDPRSPRYVQKGKGWVYDREAAIKAGKEYYRDFSNNMNAVMNKANSPDVDLNFSVRSYMQGQPQLGLGETNYKIYPSTYDVAAQTGTGKTQIDMLHKMFNGITPADLIISLGDNRSESGNLQRVNHENDLARTVADAMIRTYDTNFNDKTQSRTFFTTSYVEKSGGPDQPQDEKIFSMTIKPGLKHGELYKKYFDNGTTAEKTWKQNYNNFLLNGITFSAPQEYDNNPYKSTNVVMSHVERTINNEKVYESPFIQNGGSFKIYKDSQGQYVQEFTSYGVQKNENGIDTILPDPTTTKVLQGAVDPAQLDAHKLTLLEMLNTIAKSNMKLTK